MKNLCILAIVLSFLTIKNYAQNCNGGGWFRNLEYNKTYIWKFENSGNIGVLRGPNGSMDDDAQIRAHLYSALKWAFNEWKVYLSGTGIQFQEDPNATNLDIRVDTGPTNGVGSGEAYFNTNPMTVRLNSTFQYHSYDLAYAVASNYADVHATWLHEIGHLLGFFHNTELNSIMYSLARVRTLSVCDLERISNIYNPIEKVTVKNSFGSGQIKIDNATSFENIPATGITIETWRELSFPHSFTAKLTQEKDPITFTQRFQNWTGPNGTSNLTISVPLPTTSNPTFVANYEDEFDITFTNYHPRGETGGKIKVDGVEIDSPADAHAYGNNKIKGKAIDHYIDQIHFTFKTWDVQGGINREYEFSQSGHANYVAKFEGRPTNSYRNQRFNSKVVGQPIIVYWNQHPSTNVSHYKVYRKPKYGSETCVKTVNRTGGSSHTYTFTDPDMVHTNSSSSYNLYYYDVRAYYDNSPLSNGKYSDYDFKPVYAEMGGPQRDDTVQDERMQIAEKIYEYGISNYPNPYNPTTTISYSIKEQGNVQITVYDALGRKVADLVNEIKQPGSYSAMFNGSNLTSGIYFYTMKVNDFMETKKMLLTK